MTLIEKIHAWVRKHTTVCGMTLDEIDEMKAKAKREARYKELLLKREDIAIRCYSAIVAHPSRFRDDFKAAYSFADDFMEELHGKEWRETKAWRKERGMA